MESRTAGSLYEELKRSYAPHKNEERYSAPMNAIIWSNYGRKGDAGIMCEALYDLFADELERKMNEGLERGERKGRREGEICGKAEGRAGAILELLEELGECPPALRAALMRERDIDTLRRWNKLAARAESVAEFEESSGILEHA